MQTVQQQLDVRHLHERIFMSSSQVGAGGEGEEDHVCAAGRLHLHPLHHQTLPLHPGQTGLPQLW